MATIPNQTAHQAATTTNRRPLHLPALRPHLLRHFTRPGISPYDEIVWELRDAIIQDFKGRIIFEQKNVEVPADWSMTATNIVASKYLHGLNGTDERESGVRALITRVAESIRDWGIARRLLRLHPPTPTPSTPSSPTSSSTRRSPSTRPSGST